MAPRTVGILLALAWLGSVAAEGAFAGCAAKSAPACPATEDEEEASLLQRGHRQSGPALSQAGQDSTLHAAACSGRHPARAEAGAQRCTLPGACKWPSFTRGVSSALRLQEQEPQYIGAGCCRPPKSFKTWSWDTTKHSCAEACRVDIACQAFTITGCANESDPTCGGHCYLYDMTGGKETWYASHCGDPSHEGNAFCHAVKNDSKSSVPPGWSDNDIKVGNETRHFATYTCSGCEGKTVPLVLVGPGTSRTRWDTPWEEIQAYAEEGSYAVVVLEGEGLSFNVGGHDTKPDPCGADDEQYVIDVVQSLTTFTVGRIFGMGFSRGARFFGFLTSSQKLQAADIYFSAYGAVSGVRFSYPMHGVPVPVIAVHESGDPVNTYCGNGADYWGMSVPDALRKWAAWNQCDDPRSATAGCEDPCVQVYDYPAHNDTAYFRCDPGASQLDGPNAQVLLVKLALSHHEWPPHSIKLVFSFFSKYHP